jgi:hypothetical protein
MYKVFAREAESFPKDTFTLWYDVDLDGDNSEWRKCVSDVVARLQKYYEINEIDIPVFETGEDFVELKYSINGKFLTFSCDFLLFSIFITTNDESLTKTLCYKLGSEVGWEHL